MERPSSCAPGSGLLAVTGRRCGPPAEVDTCGAGLDAGGREPAPAEPDATLAAPVVANQHRPSGTPRSPRGRRLIWTSWGAATSAPADPEATPTWTPEIAASGASAAGPRVNAGGPPLALLALAICAV